ncbi:hypothetical protein HOD30_02735 [Candidatus Peregrinibacteria bacterium]|nr:hypothetical protein [Candidatus Peregrinibacteria bacterium]
MGDQERLGGLDRVDIADELLKQMDLLKTMLGASRAKELEDFGGLESYAKNDEDAPVLLAVLRNPDEKGPKLQAAMKDLRDHLDLIGREHLARQERKLDNVYLDGIEVNVKEDGYSLSRNGVRQNIELASDKSFSFAGVDDLSIRDALFLAAAAVNALAESVGKEPVEGKDNPFAYSGWSRLPSFYSNSNLDSLSYLTSLSSSRSDSGRIDSKALDADFLDYLNKEYKKMGGAKPKAAPKVVEAPKVADVPTA